MRSSEEMALVLARAWCKTHETIFSRPSRELEWDDITEWDQEGYLAEVNALLEYLFEHGRISAYINAEQLEELRREYRAYLTAKNGS
jgi:hypothetical protein